MIKNVIFCLKLGTFSKFVIPPKHANIFNFSFDRTKSSEIYYQKQFSLIFFGNYLTLIFEIPKGQDE